MSLVRADFIPIPPGAKPGFDHADVYRPDRRMYVAHTGADRVDVLDCEQRAFLRSLRDLPGVAGVLIDEEHDLLFTSDRATARVSVFRCSDELTGRVEVGPHPNGLAYDRARRRLYSFNLGEPLGENCTTSVVDFDSVDVIAELALPGRSCWVLYAPERDIVFSNLRDPALRLLARIVHGADVSEDRDATPQSRGLLAVAEGFHLLNLGDHRQLELSLPVYDALYAWCKAEVEAGRAAA